MVLRKGVALKTIERRCESSDLRWFALVFVPALFSFALGLQWGLPSVNTWAADELVPNLLQVALDAHFAEGWHTQYPPLHLFVITFFHAPFVFFGIESDFTLALVGRVLSVLMGLGSLYFLFRLGLRFLSAPWAAFGVALFAFTPQTIYYSKIANLDIPYLFWLLASLHVFWSLVRHHRTRDYVLFAVFSMCAICTKEQAYGFYVLLIPLFFYSRYKRLEYPKIFWDRNLGLCILFFVLCFVLFENIIFAPEGFMLHLNLITGAKFKGYAMVPPTVGGHWGFLKLSVEQLAFCMSIPILLLSIVGIALTVKERAEHLWLLLPMLSYQVFLLHVVRYAYDRFFLPDVALLSLFAAYALSFVLPHWRRLTQALAVLLIAFQCLRGEDLNLMMLFDTRYQAEAWMEKRIPKDRIMGLFGQTRYLARTDQFQNRRVVSPYVGSFKDLQPPPDCIVMNYLSNKHRHYYDPTRRFMTAIRKEVLDLHEIYSLKERTFGKMLFNPKRFLGKYQFGTSNLAKISPHVKIYSHANRCLPSDT